MEKSELREDQERELIEFLRERIRSCAVKMFDWPLLPEDLPRVEKVVRKFENFVFGIDDITTKDPS